MALKDVEGYMGDKDIFMKYHFAQIQLSLNTSLDRLDELVINDVITETERTIKAQELKRRATEERIDMFNRRSYN